MKRRMFLGLSGCLTLLLPMGLGGGALPDLAASLKELSTKVKSGGGMNLKKEPFKKSALVFDDKVDNKTVGVVLANFCWLAVVEPLVQRKAYVGRAALAEALMTLLYALALLPEANIDLLIAKAHDLAQDQVNKDFAEGMGDVEKSLTDFNKLSSKPKVVSHEAAAALIAQFSPAQLNDFLKDLFIVLFKDPLTSTAVLQGQSALFIKKLPFQTTGGELVASTAYAFGRLLEALELNQKNVTKFYLFLKNTVVGALGAKSKDAQKRLEPLLTLLETGKGWDDAAFKKEETGKPEEKVSLDDKITAMVMQAFFDELFFNGAFSVAHSLELITGDEAEKFKGDSTLFEVSSLSLVTTGQRAFYTFLPRCRILFKHREIFENVEKQLRQKNKKQVEEYLFVVKNMFKGKLSPEKLDVYRKTVEGASTQAMLGPAYPNEALGAVQALVNGLIAFYAPIKEKKCVKDICVPGYMELKFETIKTTPFIKTAPNGMLLFEAPVYNTQTEELEVGPDRTVYWDEQVLCIIVKTAFRFLTELLKAVDEEGSKYFYPKLIRDFKFWETEPFPEEFLGSDALMRVKAAAGDEFKKLSGSWDLL